MYNAFAEKFKIKKINQLDETNLIMAREEILSLRLNKFHTDAFNEMLGMPFNTPSMNVAISPAWLMFPMM